MQGQRSLFLSHQSMFPPEVDVSKVAEVARLLLKSEILSTRKKGYQEKVIYYKDKEK